MKLLLPFQIHLHDYNDFFIKIGARSKDKSEKKRSKYTNITRNLK